MKNFNQSLKKFWGGGLLILLLLNVPSVYAQTGFTLSWDSEVGCLDYSYDGHKEAPLEDINTDECLLVCEGSIVTFDLDYGTQQVTDISWTTDGGQILSLTNNDATAEIKWPLANDNGNVSLHITLANGQEYDKSICVTTKAKPQGGFEILGQQSIFFCSENELIFDNQAFVPDGSQIVSSLWDFGDGTTSNDFSPAHSYIQDGDYTVTLTVYDECGCSNFWATHVIITKPGIVISCPTVVCEGAMATYTLNGPAYQNGDVNCSNYQWIVDGGHVIAQGQDYIDVLWDSVDEDGFGYVYFDQASCDVTCDNTLVVKIPVIAAQGTIQGGKTELCQDEQSRYALPRWPTTDVEWLVVNANNPSMTFPYATVIVDQRNEIVVDASGLPPGNYILKATYTNTLLQCGGKAEFHFSVLQNLEIDEANFALEICQGNTADFFLTQTISGVTWTFTKGGQTIGTASGSGTHSHATYQFNQPGHYTVSATANGYCTAYAEIDVVEIPSVEFAQIIGSDAICPGVGEEYTFIGETGGFDVKWSVDHGYFLGPDVGETVTIVFDAGFTNYQVSAHLINPNFASCESDDVLLPVIKFEPDAQIVQTTGDPNAICTSTEESFELQGYPNMDNYEWSIAPEQLAHVSSGEGTENVDILFNEPYQGQTQGTITVRAKVCGVMEEVAQLNFELNPSPVLTIVNPPTVTCPGVPFTIVINSSQQILPSSLSISFDGATNLFSGAVSTGSGNYEFQGIVLINTNPTNAINVSYTITASGPDLCGVTQIFGVIVRNPAPVIQISNTGGDTFCNAQDISTLITASLQGAGVQINQIEWYKSGNPTPVGSGATYSPNAFGTYTATATNTFGCTTISNPITVTQDCSTLIPACNYPQTTVTGKWKECDLIKLTAHYPGNPSTISFTANEGFTATHSSGLTPTNSNNTYTQEFETDGAGTYIFGYIADYGTCKDVKIVQVKVKYKAIMNKEVACDASGYQVTILNQSTYLPGSTPAVHYTYTKNPGGQIIPPDSYNNNEAVATLADGDYTLTLTLTSPGKPTCEVSQDIHLQKPDANFSIVTNPVCAEDPVYLQPDNPTPDATYLWGFQLATNTLENINPTLAGTGTLGTPIKLTVTDPYGCIAFIEETIVVNVANFGGSVVANPSDICEGESVTLNYNQENAGTPVLFDWYNDNGSLGTTTSPAFQLNSPNPGEYWVQIKDNHGCFDKGIQSAFINQIQPPHLSAQITGSVCDGEDITLTGTLTPGSAEYQISRKKNNGSYIIIEAWTSGPTITFTDSDPGVGNYSYKVEYKDPQTECTAVAIFDAIVHPTPTVTIQMGNVSCSPYAVQLTANGNQPGTYTWSNGMSGASIVVDHGGPYRVRFQPDGTECEAMATFMAPKSPDEYTWIFPTGCFTYCESHENHPYIIGPIPSFVGGYAYNINGYPFGPGIGLVPDLPLSNSLQGGLSLTLNNGYCGATTELLDVSTQYCNTCNVEVKITKIIPVDDGTGILYYQVIGGHITNPYGFAITVHLSSPDGVFNPAAITIPPYGTYNFGTNPIDFIPNGTIAGIINIQYVVTGFYGGETKILCQDYTYYNLGSGLIGSGKGLGFAKMSVVPNPVQNTTEVQYLIENKSDFKGGIIKLYSLTGKLIQAKKVNEPQGQTSFDLSGLASGTYVVVFFSQGQRIGQQILIKE